jgi:hypothetical protein
MLVDNIVIKIVKIVEWPRFFCNDKMSKCRGLKRNKGLNKK